ncbi:MAG: polysaccharide biosynthesis protein [Deltaproteobacteria bacterium]|nr:polysaccharide biosynthesis protein [Deltaproteobacteria bacterium]
MKHLITNRNFWIMFISDAFLAACAYFFSYYLRFDGTIPITEMKRFSSTVVWIVPVKLLCFYYFDLYRGMWRYTSIHDLYSLVKACTAGSALVVALLLAFVRFHGFARSVFIIDLLAIFLLVGGFRVSIRLYYHRKNRLDARMFFKRHAADLKRVLIIGAGDAGEKLLREIRENAALGYDVVGFMDDNPRKLNQAIHGVPVLGAIADMGRIAASEKVTEVIIAVPSAASAQMRGIVGACESTGLPCKTVPGLSELIEGKVSLSSVREVRYEDLIGREQARLDLDRIGGYLTGRRIMVTGGAGSIGLELCRQIAPFEPLQLLIVDINESGLYEAVLDLRVSFPGLKVRGILGSVQNDSLMKRIFESTTPQVIFHAAAYKHVPVLESHPWEAVFNNVVGTRNVLDLCSRNGVDRCVVVSTDKAVRPTSVMGASKRVDELLTQSYADTFGARFMAVRFGNVVGSAGSVVPLIQKQIRAGGPVTVTHPDITRYFMTIPESARLILQAGAMGNGGEIFILKMGTPVNIDDMARDLIRLSGLIPDEDIQIEYIGLRPGEKLTEELITEGEGIRYSDHEEIMVLTSGSGTLSMDDIARHVSRMTELAEKGDADGIKAALKRLVPEYTPWKAG